MNVRLVIEAACAAALVRDNRDRYARRVEACYGFCRAWNELDALDAADVVVVDDDGPVTVEQDAGAFHVPGILPCSLSMKRESSDHKNCNFRIPNDHILFWCIHLKSSCYLTCDTWLRSPVRVRSQSRPVLGSDEPAGL